MNNVIPIVQHPLQPFLPHNARILMLGSFPPKHEKWCMEWFYPNWINDMWRIMGYVFYHNKNHFVVKNIDGSVEKGLIEFLSWIFAARKVLPFLILLAK